MNSPAGPRFPSPHEFGKGLGLVFGPAEEVNVIRHDDIAAHCPAMPIPRHSPFTNQDSGYISSSENRATVMCAGGDEVDRRIDPDAVQAPQMPVGGHKCLWGDMRDCVVAGVADPGQVRNSCARQSPRSTTAATTVNPGRIEIPIRFPRSTTAATTGPPQERKLHQGRQSRSFFECSGAPGV